jgi:hypothetical protein
MYPPLVRLLNWCTDNGIYIHPNVRVLHEKKTGICVRAANCSIDPEQSRKRLRPLSHKLLRVTILCFLTAHRRVVSCRNSEICHSVHTLMCAGRPYSSLSVWS